MQKKPRSYFQLDGALKNLGNYLLSHMKICSIIGEKELNCRVRNGIGCTLLSMVTKKSCEILTCGALPSGLQGFRLLSPGNMKREEGSSFHIENKTHGLLVPVSSTPHSASTSGLSTR